MRCPPRSFCLRRSYQVAADLPDHLFVLNVAHLAQAQYSVSWIGDRGSLGTGVVGDSLVANGATAWLYLYDRNAGKTNIRRYERMN